MDEDLVLSKFRVVCEEFGGEVNGYHWPRSCYLPDYDNFKAFIQWMHRNQYDFKKGELSAYYEDAPDLITYSMSKGVSSLQIRRHMDFDTLAEVNKIIFPNQISNAHEDYIQNGDELFFTAAEKKRIISSIKNKPFRKNATVNLSYDTTDEEEGYWYADINLHIPIEKNVKLSLLLKDAEDTTYLLMHQIEKRYKRKIQACVGGKHA